MQHSPSHLPFFHIPLVTLFFIHTLNGSFIIVSIRSSIILWLFLQYNNIYISFTDTMIPIYIYFCMYCMYTNSCFLHILQDTCVTFLSGFLSLLCSGILWYCYALYLVLFHFFFSLDIHKRRRFWFLLILASGYSSSLIIRHCTWGWRLDVICFFFSNILCG